MPAAKQSGRTTRAASRGRSSSSSNGSRSRGQSPSSKRSATRSATRKSQATKRPRAQASASANGSRAQSSNGTLVHVGISALSATIGVAGGVLLGRTALQRNRKVWGVSVPSKVDLGGVGQQIGEAGRQFGKLASEVRAVREKAEQVGKILN